MPPTTRSKTKSTAADPAAAAAAEAEAERLAASEASAAEERRQKTRDATSRRKQRLQALSDIQHKPDVTVAELSEFMEDKPAAFWDFKLWGSATKHFISSRNFAPLWWYLNEIQKDIGWSKMTMLTSVLNTVYDADSTFMLASWTGLRNFLKAALTLPANSNNAYPWWEKHVDYAKDSNVYISILMKNRWYVSVKQITDVYHARPQEMIDAAADLIYRLRLRESMIFQIHDSFGYINGEEAKARGYVNSVDPNRRALLLALIRKHPGPIVAKDNTTENSINLFLARCLRDEASNSDMLEAFAAKFSMREPYNSNWLTDLFRYVIAPSTGHPVNAKKKQEFRDIVKYVLRRYKLDVNKLFVQLYSSEQKRALETAGEAENPYKLLVQLFPGDQDRALGRETAADSDNQYELLGMYMPLVAFAVMSDKAAVVFVQSLGGKLLPEMRSLATDPEVVRMFALQEFVRTNRATRIQRAYKERMYAPDHPTQTRRAADWNARLGSGGGGAAAGRKAASGAAVRRKK
jgi:hypothetical protein